jgi:hypothetical protein
MPTMRIADNIKNMIASVCSEVDPQPGITR